MRQKGMTTKPCPMCKENNYRKAEDVCDYCKSLHKLAQETVADLTKDCEKELYGVPSADYNLPYIEHQPAFGEGFGKEFEKHFFKLIRLLSVKTANRSWCSEQKLVEGSTEVSMLVSMRKDVRDELNEIYQLCKKCVNDAYTEGKKDGSSLLMALAKGEKSIEDFNKQTMK